MCNNIINNNKTTTDMKNLEIIELNENNCREYTEEEFWAKIEQLEEEKKEDNEPIKKGDDVNLHGYVYAGRGTKQVKHICGEVVKTTEKAICVNEFKNNKWFKTWVPKSAIYNIEKCTMLDEIEADLKSWFVKS